MKIEQPLSEACMTHVKQLEAERAKLIARRNEALAVAYEADRELAMLNRYVQMLMTLQVREHGLPLSRDYELINGCLVADAPEGAEPQKVNGVAHGG